MMFPVSQTMVISPPDHNGEWPNIKTHGRMADITMVKYTK